MTEKTVAIYKDIKNRFKSLGYSDNLLYENYKFTDILSSNLIVRSIPLAVFYQDPPSYHSACFGVCIANGQSGPPLVTQFRSLGAPQIFEIHSSGISRWGIPSSGDPQFLEQIDESNLSEYFRKRKQVWSPSNIRGLKTVGNISLTQQLDFLDMALLPLLDKEVQEKFDKLLTSIIKQCTERYPSIEDEYPKLFHLIFRLIAAKILGDRKHPGRWLNPDPQVVINEVERYYFQNETPEPVLSNIAVQQDIWHEIINSFHFQNLSVETLAYVYERTLVTPEFRKRTSTHGTPPAIAEYIMRKLPFQEIDQDKRYVFEPFSGHAVFLVAALRKLRGVLDSPFSPKDRHNYFKNMLSGIEYEPFSREVGRLSLILADYPNPDGWNLSLDDVFSSSDLDAKLTKANIVLCNPPFEDFTWEERARYKGLTSTHKPAEILNRVLKTPPKLLGFVLPHIFISGRGYRSIRDILSQTYSSIEILALPDNVFSYSEADSVLLIASGKSNATIHLSVGQVYEKDLDKFYTDYTPSFCKQSKINAEPEVFSKTILLPELGDVWDALNPLSKLEDHASVHRGMKYNHSIKGVEGLKRVVSNQERENFAKGLHRVSGSLELYFIRGYKYLNISPTDMKDKAYEYDWGKPKIIANAFRRSRGHWRITSSPDYEGLYCTQNFHGIWVNDNTPLEVISAILNGPIANAFISDLEMTSEEIRVSTLNNIPIPDITKTQSDMIVELVSRYAQTRQQWLDGILVNDSARIACDKLLRRIDGEVLQMYNLPQKLVKKLLEYFTGHPRPLPKDMKSFDSYYPKEFQQRMIDLQETIKNIDLHQEGTPEERAIHKIEMLESLDSARRRANESRLFKG